jgi:hypothetical protein
MNKYKYFPEHKGILPLPEAKKPIKYSNFDNHGEYIMFCKGEKDYNNWLSKKISVLPQDEKHFEGKEVLVEGVDYKLDYQILKWDVWGYVTFEHFSNTVSGLRRLVAIPINTDVAEVAALRSRDGNSIKHPKYKSPYEAVVTYKSDKNFTVRLKAMINRAMTCAGYSASDEKFKRIIESFDNSEECLFEFVELKPNTDHS